MIVEIKVPTPGESISEVEITTWLVKDGDLVTRNQDLAEIESDKATLSLVAAEAGKINILVAAGTTVKVDSVACTIDTSVAVEAAPKPVTQPKEEPKTATDEGPKPPAQSSPAPDHVKVSPLAQQLMAEYQLNVDDIINGLRRISSDDVKLVVGHNNQPKPAMQAKVEVLRNIQRQKMTQLRKKLSQRLVAVKNETAMLTTFNEVDMSTVMKLRAQYNKEFQEKFGIKAGLMSFFLKASAIALKHFPMVNSMIDGEEIVTPGYADISVAVQTPKGLMVPVIRNVETLSLAEIELKLKELADKARSGKISLDEMTGGTFTVTNGGVFGSMLSTPLINPPQSGILGMHNIVDRPMAVDGKVEIRPVMYVALSYDHRIIDGKDSVSFLKKVKELIENPIGLLTNGHNPEKQVLGLE
ncbi:MAG: 2-oxoglutarate dehydrogenase complex dihydrolipoyllysine-residue succinyltransferase [Breznakibacter sp.]